MVHCSSVVAPHVCDHNPYFGDISPQLGDNKQVSLQPAFSLENIMFSLEFSTFHTSPKILFVAWMNRFKNSFNIGKWNCSCGGVVVSEGRRETQSLEMKINASKFASLWRREESGDCRLGGESVRVELLR